MIINGLKVTKEDFEGLLKDLKTMQALNNTSDREGLNYMLESLISRLETNLKADEQRELRIHDMVEVISSDDEDIQDYIVKVWWIIDINKSREYPYEVEFQYKNFSDDWLWKKEELKLI